MLEFTFNRDTKETKISIKINLDGSGKNKIDTGIASVSYTHLTLPTTPYV